MKTTLLTTTIILSTLVGCDKEEETTTSTPTPKPRYIVVPAQEPLLLQDMQEEEKMRQIIREELERAKPRKSGYQQYMGATSQDYLEGKYDYLPD